MTQRYYYILPHSLAHVVLFVDDFYVPGGFGVFYEYKGRVVPFRAVRGGATRNWAQMNLDAFAVQMGLRLVDEEAWRLADAEFAAV